MLRKIIKFIIDGAIQIECAFFTRKIKRSKSILIFRKDGMGDYIIFYPFLKYFRAYYRDYEISLVIPKIANGLTPLLKDFDKIIEYDAQQFSNNFFYRRSFIKNLARKGYEIAIYPAYSRESIGDTVIKLTNATKKIGVKTSGKNSIYTDLIEIPSNITSEIYRNAYFTEYCTHQKVKLSFPTIDVSVFDNAKSNNLLSTYNLISGNFCVIFPGAGAEYRRWPEERFAAVCDHLISRDIIPVICGGTNDKTFAERILNNSAHQKRIINLTGMTDIATLAHILNVSLFYFGNETGALHLAVALNVPTVCLLGGGVFLRFFPYGNPQRNMYIFDEHMRCKNDYWKCGEKCKDGERAPCILGISLENAKKIIDTMLYNLDYQNKHLS